MRENSEQIETIYDRGNAVEHYLSSSRRDHVKVEWEEPFSCSVFKQAISSLNHKKEEELHVLDVGSGTGDGYALLSKLCSQNPSLCASNTLDYLGLDFSPEMVETATKIFSENSNVRFECADIRTNKFSQPIDLYLSCGVPYSHLTHEELYQCLTNIFENICHHRSRCSLIVNVLGRYSVEWTPKWKEDSWDYRMNFFQSQSEQEPTLMHFYGHEELQLIIEKAANSVGCPITSVDFFDRSIMVGRHTSTRQFNPSLRPYRDLINGLFDPEHETDLSQLIFQVDLGEAPHHILDFFDKFSSYWNTLVGSTMTLLGQSLLTDQVDLPTELQGFHTSAEMELQKISDQSLRRQKLELLLAQALGKLEAIQQPGYGVGHDLFSLICLDATKI